MRICKNSFSFLNPNLKRNFVVETFVGALKKFKALKIHHLQFILVSIHISTSNLKALTLK